MSDNDKKDLGRGTYEDKYGQERSWFTHNPVKPFVLNLPTFSTDKSGGHHIPSGPLTFAGFLGTIVGALIAPAGVFAFGAICLEVIGLVIMPYLLLSTKSVGEHLNYHPIIGVMGCFLGLYIFILINCFWFTAYPYTFFSSLHWMIWVFDNTNVNKIRLQTLNRMFVDPLGACKHILDVLRMGGNGWAIYVFIAMLVVHFMLYHSFSSIFKEMTWSDRGEWSLVAIFQAIIFSLIIGGLLSIFLK
jgi:hypothetical protein